MTPGAEYASALLGRVTAIALLALIAATWRLWTPQTAFPRIPFVGWLRGELAWAEWLALALACGAFAVAALIGPRSNSGRVALLMGVSAIAFLVLADQHRFQPWAYELSLVLLLLACLPATEAIAANRLLVASVYIYSAVSKLDRSFIESGGGQIAEGFRIFLDSIHVPLPLPRPEMVAALMPAAELLIAAGFCFSRSRKAALVGSAIMHCALIAALGPWGAGNKPGVLLWNTYFIVQNIILFGLAPAGVPSVWRAAFRTLRAKDLSLSRRSLRIGAWAVLIFAVVFPSTQPFGVCDIWPGWAVYATGPERLQIFIQDVDHVPQSVRGYVQSPRFAGEPFLVRIDRWSLDATGAPIYPQNRFRLGVASALAEAGADVSVHIEGPADRWTGKRDSRTLAGANAIVRELDRDWLNGFPQ